MTVVVDSWCRRKLVLALLLVAETCAQDQSTAPPPPSPSCSEFGRDVLIVTVALTIGALIGFCISFCFRRAVRPRSRSVATQSTSVIAEAPVFILPPPPPPPLMQFIVAPAPPPTAPPVHYIALPPPGRHQAVQTRAQCRDAVVQVGYSSRVEVIHRGTSTEAPAARYNVGLQTLGIASTNAFVQAVVTTCTAACQGEQLREVPFRRPEFLAVGLDQHESSASRLLSTPQETRAGNSTTETSVTHLCSVAVRHESAGACKRVCLLTNDIANVK